MQINFSPGRYRGSGKKYKMSLIIIVGWRKIWNWNIKRDTEGQDGKRLRWKGFYCIDVLKTLFFKKKLGKWWTLLEKIGKTRCKEFFLWACFWGLRRLDQGFRGEEGGGWTPLVFRWTTRGGYQTTPPPVIHQKWGGGYLYHQTNRVKHKWIERHSDYNLFAFDKI